MKRNFISAFTILLIPNFTLHAQVLSGTGTSASSGSSANSPAQWEMVSTGLLSGRPCDIFFPDEIHGYILSNEAGGDAHLFKTSDGGNTWKELVLPINHRTYLNTLFFLDSLNGYCGGKNTLLKTVDGGKSWIACNDPDINSHTIVDMYFENKQDGFFCMSGGIGFSTVAFYTATDGATTGIAIRKKVGALTKTYTSDGAGYAVTDQGYILKTRLLAHRYFSSEWSDTLPRAEKNTIIDFHLFNEMHGIFLYLNLSSSKASTDFGITEDGGKTMRFISTVPYAIVAVIFNDEKTGYGIGGTDPARLLTTSDGGINWSPVSIDSPPVLGALCSTPNHKVIVAGASDGIGYLHVLKMK